MRTLSGFCYGPGSWPSPSISIQCIEQQCDNWPKEKSQDAVQAATSVTCCVAAITCECRDKTGLHSISLDQTTAARRAKSCAQSFRVATTIGNDTHTIPKSTRSDLRLNDEGLTCL